MKELTFPTKRFDKSNVGATIVSESAIIVTVTYRVRSTPSASIVHTHEAIGILGCATFEFSTKFSLITHPLTNSDAH